MPNFAVSNNIQRIAPQKIITKKNQTNQQNRQPQKHAIVAQMPQRKQKEKNSHQPSQIPNIQIFTFSTDYHKQHFIIWKKFAKLIHIHLKYEKKNSKTNLDNIVYFYDIVHGCLDLELISFQDS